MQAQQMLQQIKRDFGINPTQVAKRLNITQSTIQRIFAGQTKDCRQDKYLKIKDFYDSLTKTP